MNNDVEWASIPNYDGLYEANNKGEIRSINRDIVTTTGIRKYKQKILTPTRTKAGYLSVKLTKNGHGKNILLHRIIALTFLANNSNYPIINHIDGNKSNNNVNNLEWVSYQINNKHAYEIGINNRNKRNTKVTILIMNKIKQLYFEQKMSQNKIACLFNISQTTARRYITKKIENRPV